MKKALSSVAGVKNVELDFKAKTVKVTIEKAKKDVDALIKVLKKEKFDATLKQ